MSIVGFALAVPLIYLSFSVLYYVSLAAAYFLVKGRKTPRAGQSEHRYLLLIPAHNEEGIIARILMSLRGIDYDRTKFDTCVIADNCTDGTALVARRCGAKVLARHDDLKRGKGFAIEWALKVLDLARFDAVVIADADNIIDPGFFHGLDEVLDAGSNAVQCNNCLANSSETAFTRVIHLSRTINNLLYHEAKYRVGLSSYLMGNGMCFTTRLLDRYPWATGTMAEDYEYYAILACHGEPVGFAVNSRLYHQESKGLQPASRQRLRWSSGRFEVARKFGVRLLAQGLKARDARIIDASFPLLLPNLSLMVNLSIALLAAAIFIHIFHPVPGVIAWLSLLILLELGYFTSGMYLARMPAVSFLMALGFAPFFLVWKGCIDILGLSGTRAGQWGRSGRA